MSELALAVFAASTDSHLVDRPRSARFEAFRRSFDEREFLRGLEAKDVRWIPRSDPGFPRRLAGIHDPPPGLFVRGSADLGLLERPTVAVVGARACSAYGTQVAFALGRELAAAGAVVVSGLARGVDAAAHRGALEAGTTVAVLGCGIDRDYPRAHADLGRRIAEWGLILSEYPPGVEPAPWRFPARNRIVAGLSEATVVVEARARSGALITADLALDEGRDVLAVPGEITSALSAGSNGLLRLGAVPVTSTGDVLEVLGIEPDGRQDGAGAVDDLPLAAGAVLSHVGAAAVSADELVRLTDLDASVVSAALVELELRGLVEQHDGVFRGVMPL